MKTVSYLVIVLLRAVALLPLPAVRGLGRALGVILCLVVRHRVRVVDKNLLLCFPELDMTTRQRHRAEIFKNFAQTWLDRAWLWHAPAQLLKQRLQITGAIHALEGSAPTVLFAPHFMGLDAGWTALTLLSPRTYTTIYTEQANRTMDRWILRGRQRFGGAHLFTHADGVRSISARLKKGDPLYLLPDMDFGEDDSIFVPFFGVQAATVPSLSRFAKLGGARSTPVQVVPVVTRMTKRGYEVQILPAWENFPTEDLVADTARMNRELQAMVAAQIAEYYWVHKRFKTRPAGAVDFYG